MREQVVKSHLPVLLVKLIDIILFDKLLELCQITHGGSFVNLPEVLFFKFIANRKHTPIVGSTRWVFLPLGEAEYLLHCVRQSTIAFAPSPPDTHQVLEDHHRRLSHPWN